MKNEFNFTKISVGYTRVSSKEQETGYSLDAQKRLAEEYADKNSLQIKQLYRVSESASGKKQRQVFKEMFEYARKNKVVNILVEKIDRLTRNPKEAVMVQEWLDENSENQVHCIKENFILSKDSKAHEKFMWGIKVSVGKFYIDNLSEEVRKGLNEKANQGMYPGSFKLGYLSVGDKGNKKFIKDSSTNNQVKNLLERYASGNFSMKALVHQAWDIGLRSRYGKRLHKSQIESLLKDPFYYGRFDWKGELKEGVHTPTISKEIFDMIQEVRTRRKTPFYKQHRYLFMKMLNCGECGGLMVSETQKGIIYCHCSRYRECTQKKYERQDKIESKLTKLLSAFEKLTLEEADAVREGIRLKHQKEADYKMSVIDSLSSQYKAVQIKIDRLYDDRLSGVIDSEFWSKKNEQLLAEQKGFQEQLERLKGQEAEYFELFIDILQLAQKARSIYENERRTDDEKRMLLRNIFTELKVRDGEVTYTLKTPVQKYSDRLNTLENIFEPENSLPTNLKHSTDARIAMMLPRQGSNLRPND